VKQASGTRVKYRGGSPRFKGVLALVCGLGLLIGFVVLEVDSYALRTHGVRATAGVDGTKHDGHNRSYLLTFSGPGGSPVSEWTDDVRSGTKVGDRITVVYDPQDVSNVEDQRDEGRGPWADLVLLAGAAFFLWTAYTDLRPATARPRRNPRNPFRHQ